MSFFGDGRTVMEPAPPGLPEDCRDDASLPWRHVRGIPSDMVVAEGESVRGSHMGVRDFRAFLSRLCAHDPAWPPALVLRLCPHCADSEMVASTVGQLGRLRVTPSR